jgi:hypothetical protein
VVAAEFGVAWIADDERELGSIGGIEELETARRQAVAAFDSVFPHATKAVIDRGRSRADGVVVDEVPRPERRP